jgi:signal transduction histidine kinase
MKVKMGAVEPHFSSFPSEERAVLPKVLATRWQVFFLLAVTVMTLPLHGERFPIPSVILASLVLGSALLIPWGLREQGLVCGIVAVSYLIAAHSSDTIQAVENLPYGLLGLGVSIGVSLIGVFWQQDQRKRLAEQKLTLQQQMQESEALQEFSRALTSALSRSQLLPPLTMAVQRLCQCHGLVVGMLAQERQDIDLWTQTDLSLHDRRLSLEPLLMKEILQVGWPVFIPDLAHPTIPAELFNHLARAGHTSLLVVPLRAVHRVVGVLLIGWRTSRVNISRHEEELLQFIADQTVQALSNIRLYQEQERHLSESETLRRVGQLISATLNLQGVLKLVTEEGARLLGCEASALTWGAQDNACEIAGASGFLAPWRGAKFLLAGSVTEMVIRERRAIRDEEVQAENLPLRRELATIGTPPLQAFLSVPLWRGEQPMGTLTVASSSARTFSLNDERILQALADQAMHAINNAQLYEQLQGALQREQEASRQKSAFFASASHELRTPLNIILGYVDLIREGVVGQVDVEGVEILGRAQKAAHHMIALVNDLLDLARIERAELQLRPEAFDLEEFLQEAWTTWKKSVTEKGLVFRRVGSRSLPILVTDRARLRQILDNLIGNALKFTKAGHILVGARVLEQNIEIWVEDTGIGIDTVYHEKIFDEFQQVECSSTKQFEGFGLGLAVCKKIAVLLHGDIRVDSAVGRGSTFTVSLARQQA